VYSISKLRERPRPTKRAVGHNEEEEEEEEEDEDDDDCTREPSAQLSPVMQGTHCLSAGDNGRAPTVLYGDHVP
jgi:hypothetical protein